MGERRLAHRGDQPVLLIERAIFLGLLTYVVIRAVFGGAIARWWRYDGKGQPGRQVNYW